MKNPITIHEINGHKIPKIRGGRATKVIPDKRNKAKHKPDWKLEA